MIVFGELRDWISLTEISNISGISISSYYYSSRERRITNLDLSVKEIVTQIASERPKYR